MIREWENEPNHLAFEYKGYPCIIHRVEGHGALCGYVGLPETSKFFGKDYDEVPVECHGGLTYADHCQGPICHDSPEKRWWIGFDCSHAGDLSPALEKYQAVYETFQRDAVYRNIGYVTEEIHGLVDQLIELDRGA